MKYILGITLSIFLVSCGHIKTKSQIEAEKTEPAPVVDEAPEGYTSNEEEKVSKESEPTQKPVSPIKNGPKVAVILGPGGIKTWSYVGVLQEFERRDIPVDAVMGMGWSNLVAALYARQAKVHEVGWRLFKLGDDLFDAYELKDSELKTVRTLISKVFSQEERNEFVKDFDVDYLCPSQSIYGGPIKWIQHGKLEVVLSRCLPTPPLFKAENYWMGSLFSVKEGVRKLKKLGYEVVVVVNSLNSGDLLTKEQTEAQTVNALFWQELRNSILRDLEDLESERGVYKIQVETPHVKLFDFKKRKTLESFGRQSAKGTIDQIVREYDL